MRNPMAVLKREEENVVVRGGDVHTLLGKGSEFEGKLTFEGQVRIDGKFSGQIFTKDTLVIGEGARVNAEINAGTVIVNGAGRGEHPRHAAHRAPHPRSGEGQPRDTVAEHRQGRDVRGFVQDGERGEDRCHPDAAVVRAPPELPKR